jgi:PST family polysaccharide transporter
MLFQRTATVEISGQLAGAAVAITSALLGAEYWALAFRQIGISVTQSILLWFACDFRPGRYRRDVSIGKLLRFGGALTVSSFLLYFARRIDNIWIGKVFGDGPLGLYEQAYRLLRAPVQQIRAPLQTVSLPAMSVLQDKKVEFARYYYRFVELIAMVSMPAVLVAVIFADDLVLFILGPRWAEVATIFRWFGALAFIEPVSTTRGLVMVAHGLARRQLALQASFAASSTLAVFIGAQYSVNAVALALVVSHYVGLVPSMMFCFRDTAVSPAGFFKALTRPFLGSLAVLLVGGPLLWLLPEGTVRLFLGATACVAAYVATWWCIPPMRRRALELGSIIFSKLRPKKTAPEEGPQKKAP